MFPQTLLTTLLLALSVAANPIVVDKSPVTLQLSRHLNTTSVHNLVRHDQNRAKALRLRAEKAGSPFQSDSAGAIINEPVDNQAVTYSAAVTVGSPGTTYNLIIDTGSSNTWVGASTKYSKTSTSTQTKDKVSVSYGSGSFSGTEYTDTVSLGSGLTIPKQSIGVASTSSGFQGTDGILGIGPVDLTVGTLSPDTNTAIPTVTDNLYNNGVIDSNSIGIYFQPTTSQEALNGELTWGGVDTSKTTSTVSYVPITSTSPASFYWGIDQSITYGTSTNILSKTAGIVDTGTTLVLIASDAFKKYRTATAATADSATGLLKITSSNYSKLQSLFFKVGSNSYELTANGQTWPRSLNTYIGGTSSGIYLIVADLGSNSGQGLDFINGYTFLERYYSVYDTTNKRVGFASTAYTKATTN